MTVTAKENGSPHEVTDGDPHEEDAPILERMPREEAVDRSEAGKPRSLVNERKARAINVGGLHFLPDSALVCNG